MKKVKINEILYLYEKKLKPNIKNKRALINFEQNKMQCIEYIIKSLNDENYKIKRYHIFKIYEPKVRLIMSLNVVDKIINHYFTEYILKPNLEKYLDIRNVATRENMGTSYAIKMIKKYIEYYKRMDNCYYLKIDIKKYFFNIDHNVLKNMLVDKLDSDDYKRVCNIIDSTNEEYINREILKINDNNLTLYKYGKGLPIGNLSSQLLSIFYLSELDHYIVHDLKLKHYIRYMDDFIIFSDSKDKLVNALNKIKQILLNGYKLEINKNKTYIKNIKYGLIYLGRRFIIKDNKTIMIMSNTSYYKTKKGIKKNNYKLNNKYITFKKYFESISNYLYSYKYSINKIKVLYSDI